MAEAASGTATARGTASTLKTLPLYSVLGIGSSNFKNNDNNDNKGRRGQSLCPSICSSGKRSSSAISSDEGSDNSDSSIKGSDDEESDFKIVKRKNKRVPRRLRKLNSYSIKNGIPFHTYALEEDRKVKVIIKGIPVEIETEDIKADLERQKYPVQAVHRMHRRDGTALGLVLVILNKTDGATEIFKNLANVCGLSGITVEAPYEKRHPRAVPSLSTLRPRGHKLPRPTAVREMLGSTLDQGVRSEYLSAVIAKATKQTNSTNSYTYNKPKVKTSTAPKRNQWKNPLPWVNSKITETANRVSHKQPTRQAETTVSVEMTSAL
ncbi:hypothetical protein EVAR_82943_1 [Eumeta japonica]|uniref:Pre-C2HC domain-containing protein n=1 Tax=Eumeta variegata TaxID=151549 RepID=A0A4C1X0N2_EUMVA|nr:hypothetical protein EVAR_82943_1 [Eumeta japonica]